MCKNAEIQHNCSFGSDRKFVVMGELHRTALYDLHKEFGAKMVPFAGYEMPVQYRHGVMAEHVHTRSKAGLFDVSHMGQMILRADRFDIAAQALETLIPIDILDLPLNRQRYGFLTNDKGGIRDDLMLSNRGDHIFMVVNAACKKNDLMYLQSSLQTDVSIIQLTDRSLLALQGPRAATVLGSLNSASTSMRFMDVATLLLNGVECWVSRSGYSGEDGYEISLPSKDVLAVTTALLSHPDVEPIGLAARDSLRLEAGLCLYGHDMDASTTPTEANLGWAISKARRLGGSRAGGFPGDERILNEKPAKKRVGLIPEGKAPMRESTKLYAQEDSGGDQIGQITSGGFGPSIGGPVAMGYVPTQMAVPGTRVFGNLRGKNLPLKVASLPFVSPNFKR